MSLYPLLVIVELGQSLVFSGICSYPFEKYFLGYKIFYILIHIKIDIVYID